MHGTIAAYLRGCHCVECTTTATQRTWRKRLARRVPPANATELCVFCLGKFARGGPITNHERACAKAHRTH